MSKNRNKNGQLPCKTPEPATGDSSNGRKRKGAYVPTSVEDLARYREQTRGARNIE